MGVTNRFDSHNKHLQHKSITTRREPNLIYKGNDSFERT